MGDFFDAKFIDYAQLYVQGKIAINTGDQALYSKRLLEYTIAKDAGAEALKTLSSRWEAEDKEMAKRLEANNKTIWSIFIIVLLVVGILCVWVVSMMYNF